MTSNTFPDPWEQQRAAIGAMIRNQRELANMSLRQLSQATKVSNAYLSQIERGLHDPTLRVLHQIGEALHLSVEDMLVTPEGADGDSTDQAPPRRPRRISVETAIRMDPDLTKTEKDALIGVYRTYVAAHQQPAETTAGD